MQDLKEIDDLCNHSKMYNYNVKINSVTKKIKQGKKKKIRHYGKPWFVVYKCS